MSRNRRSTGTTRTFREIFTAYRPELRKARQAADIATVDDGESVTLICNYRGTYGNYPQKFMMCYLDLNPNIPVIRPLLLFGRFSRNISVTEGIISVKVRPFAGWAEASRVRGSGQYAAGGSLAQTGTVAISCKTADGLLEFAVHRPDVELVLHYFGRLADHSDRDNPA